MRAHNLATLPEVIPPTLIAFNFLRHTINHQSSMTICVITFLQATVAATTTTQEVWHSLDEFHLASHIFLVWLRQKPMISAKV